MEVLFDLGEGFISRLIGKMAASNESSTNSCWDTDIKIVLEVRERPCLYDMTAKNYRSTDARQKSWEEIAEIMGMPSSVCATKWKTIRDRYVRLYKRSGSEAADVIEDPSWIVSSYLSFLLPSIKTKRTSGNYPDPPSQTLTESQSSVEITLYEVDEHSDAGCVQTPSSSGGSTPSLQSLEGSVVAGTSTAQASTPTVMTPTVNTTVTPVVPGKRRRTQQSTIESVLQAMHAPVVINRPAPEPDEDCDIFHFLKSLRSDMRRASPLALRTMKVRMLNVIAEELEKDSERSCHC